MRTPMRDRAWYHPKVHEGITGKMEIQTLGEPVRCTHQEALPHGNMKHQLLVLLGQALLVAMIVRLERRGTVLPMLIRIQAHIYH
ncbi:hypothetical protein VNO77_10201 [Canavalia gladiata]|uniref:Uncharacterized protein n=1 Tax=Canavalia gladiata TaxID=3824 RepID=A0AAN9MGP5_CANGL